MRPVTRGILDSLHAEGYGQVIIVQSELLVQEFGWIVDFFIILELRIVGVCHLVNQLSIDIRGFLLYNYLRAFTRSYHGDECSGGEQDGAHEPFCM